MYLASGKIPWYLVAYDRQEGTWETLLESEPTDGYVGINQVTSGVLGSARGIKGTDGESFTFWLHDGQVVRREGNALPWEERVPFRADPPKPSVEFGATGPDLEGNVEIAVQSHVDQSWRPFSFSVPTYGQPIYRLYELPPGYAIIDHPGAEIFGTAAAYQGNFGFDATGVEAKHLGRIHLSHYATTFCNGKIYMSGYPKSPLYEYDPGQTWTTGTVVDGVTMDGTQQGSNPRLIGLLGDKEVAGTHKMHAAVTGSDAKVYLGGQWWRDGEAGGFAWYDTETGEVSGFWEALSNYQVSHMATAQGGDLIVLSTWAVSDPLLEKPTPDQGALFTFDTSTGELSPPFAPISNISGTGPIVTVDDRHVLGWASHPSVAGRSILYLVDIVSREIVYKKVVPYAMPVSIESTRTEAWDYRMGKDGMLWTFMDDVLVRVTPDDGCIEVIGRVAPGQIAFLGDDLYLGGENAIRRVVGPFTKDLEPPVISGLPEDILVVKEAGMDEAVVAWQVPVATDNVGVTQFQGTHEPGAAFSLGTTTVSYSASDAAGNETTVSFTVTIEAQQLPAIAWGNPAAMEYGVPLGGDQLNASVNVSGSFVYDPPVGTVLSAGAGQLLTVSFESADPNFTNAIASVTISVGKAPLFITADDNTRGAGLPNPVFSVRYAGFVNGDTPADLDVPVAIVTAASEGSPQGFYPIVPSGAEAANYSITFVPGSLTVTANALNTATVRFEQGEGGQLVLIFQWQTIEGMHYRIEGSSDLMQWSPIEGMRSIVAEGAVSERTIPFEQADFYLRAVRTAGN